jgi:hypothetical protein
MIFNEKFGKDYEQCGCLHLTEILSRNLPGGTEETKEEPVRIGSRQRFEPKISRIQV